jgi:hypothetical protein
MTAMATIWIRFCPDKLSNLEWRQEREGTSIVETTMRCNHWRETSRGW